MGKKYLIDEVILKDLNLKGLRFDTKEVEVLDDSAVCEIHYKYTTKSSLNHFLKENNLLIVKIIE